MTNLYPSLLDLWRDPISDNQHQTTSFITMPSTVNVATRTQTTSASENADSLYPSLDQAKSGLTKSVKVARNVDGKIGVRIESIHGGFFVVLSFKNSPASLAGLKFGDQILKINDIPVNGYSLSKLWDLIRKSSGNYLTFFIKTRPLITKITLNRDQQGCLGFTFNNRGSITGIIKDSSAAINGLLIDQNILEINSYNAIGLSKSEIRELIHGCGREVTLTLMQSRIYEMMTKESSAQLIRENLENMPLSIW